MTVRLHPVYDTRAIADELFTLAIGPFCVFHSTGPESIPRDTDYASVFHSNTPIVVQHTRLDSNPSIALLSTIAFAAPSD